MISYGEAPSCLEGASSRYDEMPVAPETGAYAESFPTKVTV